MDGYDVSFVPPDSIYQGVASVPSELYDPWWLIGTLVIIIFLPLLTFFVKRLVVGIDKTNTLLTEMRIDYAGTKTKLDDHMENELIHCKGIACKMAKG